MDSEKISIIIYLYHISVNMPTGTVYWHFFTQIYHLGNGEFIYFCHHQTESLLAL